MQTNNATNAANPAVKAIQPVLLSNQVIAILRSDKRKNPKKAIYRYMSHAELKNAKNHISALDRNGNVVNVAVTSIKTWKTRAEIEVHYKFGLYEFGYVTVYPNQSQTFFVEWVQDIE